MGSGGATGTGPCAGLCTSTNSLAPGTKSPDLGTGAACMDVVGTSITHIVCGNFVSPRTMTINGTTTVDCVTGGGYALPAAVNGGWCFQASSGQYTYAYFQTY
jgi:hypothetical protein